MNVHDAKQTLLNRLGVASLAESLEFPLYFEIETSGVCNAKCQMCTVNQWSRNSYPFLKMELFRKIASEICSHQKHVRVVNLSRDGEPLLDKDLEEKISLLKEGGVPFVTFSTNASLLLEERARDLLASGLDDIMFSIDGYSKETFEQIRQGLHFEEVRSNVLRFISLRDKLAPHVKIRVRMVVQAANQHEVTDWAEFWRSQLKATDNVHAKSMHTWGNQLAGASSSCVEKLLHPCTSPFSTMIIRHNGMVTLCPLDFDFTYVNGNTVNSSIREIWKNGPQLQVFRQWHLEGKRDDLPLCRGCRLWEANTSRREF
jgi:MoaA/NifB/PqqE/SkfB family radical SAM enzyme